MTCSMLQHSASDEAPTRVPSISSCALTTEPTALPSISVISMYTEEFKIFKTEGAV